MELVKDDVGLEQKIAIQNRYIACLSFIKQKLEAIGYNVYECKTAQDAFSIITDQMNSAQAVLTNYLGDQKTAQLSQPDKNEIKENI